MVLLAGSKPDEPRMSVLPYRNTPRVLVIDDNPSIHRDFNLVLLEELPGDDLEAEERRLYGEKATPGIAKPAYSVDHAFAGLEGIEKVRQSLAEARPYQLAFVDIRMPGIDGVETIERLWQLDPALQVVICTAYADYSWDELTRRLGHTDKLLVLKKPFDSIEVTQMASTLCEKWFLARQAALKYGEMELLVARRTERLLAIQPREAVEHTEPEPVTENRPEPLLLVLLPAGEQPGGSIRDALGAGYHLLEALDSNQVLNEAQENVPDLILLESADSSAGELELCRALKGNELTSHIPIIVLAGTGRAELQTQALEAGADDFLSRPVDLPRLKPRVDHLLRSRGKASEPSGPVMPLQPRELAANPGDALFLQRTLEIVDKHLPDFEFDVDVLAQKLAVSRRQLFRKLRAVTGRTPNALVRSMRLNRAAQLLTHSRMTVTEITYAVGFSDLKHFRTVFREQFGVLPGEYTRKNASGEAA